MVKLKFKYKKNESRWIVTIIYKIIFCGCLTVKCKEIATHKSLIFKLHTIMTISSSKTQSYTSTELSKIEFPEIYLKLYFWLHFLSLKSVHYDLQFGFLIRIFCNELNLIIWSKDKLLEATFEMLAL